MSISEVTPAVHKAEGLHDWDCVTVPAQLCLYRQALFCCDFVLRFNVWRDTEDFFRLRSWLPLWWVCMLKLKVFGHWTITFRGFFFPGRNTSRSEEFGTQMWSALCARPSRSIRQVLYLQEMNLKSPRLSFWEISSLCVGCFGSCQTFFKDNQ